MEKEIVEKYLINKVDMEIFFKNRNIISKEKLEKYYINKDSNFNAILMQRQEKIIKNEGKRDNL